MIQYYVDGERVGVTEFKRRATDVCPWIGVAMTIEAAIWAYKIMRHHVHASIGGKIRRLA